MNSPIDPNRPSQEPQTETTTPPIVSAENLPPKALAKHIVIEVPPKHTSPLIVKPAPPPRSRELLEKKIVLLKQKYDQIQNEFERTEIPHEKIACYISMKTIKNQISYIKAEKDAVKAEEHSLIMKTIYKGFDKACQILNPFGQVSRPANTSVAGTFPFNPLTYAAALADTASFFSDLYKLTKTTKQLQIITSLEKKGIERLSSIGINIQSERIYGDSLEERGESRVEADSRIQKMETEREILLQYLKPLADLKKKVDPSSAGHRLGVGVAKMGLSYLDVAHAIIGFASIFVIAQTMVVTGLAVSSLSVLFTGALVAVDFLVTRANLKNAVASLHNLQFLSVKFRASLEEQWKKVSDVEIKKVSENSLNLFENTVTPYLKQKLEIKIIEQWLIRASDVLVIAATAAAVVTTILAVTTVGAVALPLLLIPIAIGASAAILILSSPFLAKWIVEKQNGKKIPKPEEFQQTLFKQLEEEQANWSELVRNDLHYHTNTYVLYNLVKDYYRGGLSMGPQEWAQSLVGPQSAEARRAFDKALNHKMLHHEARRLTVRQIEKMEAREKDKR